MLTELLEDRRKDAAPESWARLLGEELRSASAIKVPTVCPNSRRRRGEKTTFGSQGNIFRHVEADEDELETSFRGA